MAYIQKPDWLKIKIPTGKELRSFNEIRETLKEQNLHTVCVEANCPNAFECWSHGTATFMILGDTCTRHCGFCNVKSAKNGAMADETEPFRIAGAVKKWKLNYAVITSVDRDDLKDLGAIHFSKCIKEIKKFNPKTLIEVLIPDFQGKIDLLRIVAEAQPDVIAHNIETVKELQGKVRDRKANYECSLNVLKNVKKIDSKIYTKTSILLGLGETREHVLEAMNDLRKIEVDFLAIGQYLSPSGKNLKVERFVSPKEFEFYKIEGEKMGFKFVASAPFVRTSYKAFEFFLKKTL